MLRYFNTMSPALKVAWYQALLTASKVHSTIQNAIKKECLALPNDASQCQAKKQKFQCLRWLTHALMPLDTSHCQTRDHSHSIVPGGLEVTS